MSINHSEARYIPCDKIFTPQNYLCFCVDKTFIIEDNTIEFIDKILELYSVKNNWGNTIRNYSLSDIHKIIDDKVRVVLVDVSGFNDDETFIQEYRWYEVPAKCTVNGIKHTYLESDVVMSELLRYYVDFLFMDEIEELLIWAGDDEFMSVTESKEIITK